MNSSAAAHVDLGKSFRGSINIHLFAVLCGAGAYATPLSQNLMMLSISKNAQNIFLYL